MLNLEGLRDLELGVNILDYVGFRGERESVCEKVEYNCEV